MPKGKAWPEGRTPWTIAGDTSESTFNTALRLDVLKKDFGSKRMRALREAYEGVGLPIPPKYLPPVPEAVEAVPQAPVAVPVPSVTPIPAATSQAGPTARSATVGVSYRATVEQHDKLRAIAYTARRPLQDLLNEAVNDFLAKEARRG